MCVSESPLQFYVNHANSPSVSAYGPGLVYGTTNKTAMFTIYTEDASEGVWHTDTRQARFDTDVSALALISSLCVLHCQVVSIWPLKVHLKQRSTVWIIKTAPAPSRTCPRYLETTTSSSDTTTNTSQEAHSQPASPVRRAIIRLCEINVLVSDLPCLFVYRGQQEKVSGEARLGRRFLSGHQRDRPQSSDGEHQSSIGPRRAVFTEETTQQSHRYVGVLKSRCWSRLWALMTRAVCFRYFLHPERGRRTPGEHQEERSSRRKQSHHYNGGAVGDRRRQQGEGVRSGSGGGTHLWDVWLCGGHAWRWWETVFVCRLFWIWLSNPTTLALREKALNEPHSLYDRTWENVQFISVAVLVKNWFLKTHSCFLAGWLLFVKPRFYYKYYDYSSKTMVNLWLPIV